MKVPDPFARPARNPERWAEIVEDDGTILDEASMVQEISGWTLVDLNSMASDLGIEDMVIGFRKTGAIATWHPKEES